MVDWSHHHEGYAVDRAEPKIDFDAPAVLRKSPSIDSKPAEEVRWPQPHLVMEGTLDECIQGFLAKPANQRHLYEIHTASQNELVSSVVPADQIAEIARLREIL